jgi:hypothetical protein
MATKVYKSAMGRVVDMGALMLENENTRAVGNMNVNARGDVLDSANRVVETKNRQVAKHYQRQIAAPANHLPTTSTQAAKKQQSLRKAAKEKVAKDTPAPAKSRAAKVVNESVLDVYNDERLVSNYDKIQAAEDVPDIESMDELTEFEAAIPELTEDPVVVPEKVAVPRGGLAAAIARTQSVKQELMKTPRQLAQNKPGVNKI